ncbi:anhydro-N-acetylmuramic acid kinase [Propylenella binzhouense]|uniref:Anhydro-N-acetylmuramic acid kinase n=1 Tax=Propylenella binzhouense TaxID=2555902 RepID=A0A964T3C8_9HYPH|nr:anhydro-N-acetylmuramic acid kinase [Propylenella binzhouense]MYZ47192.1 anhydro-N-acetylmuramic acid kinase [Propylenella binzhouense]
MQTAIGLMSGTSLDGVDVALIATDGERIAELGPARTYPYSASDRACLKRALDAAPGATDRNDRPPELAEAERLVTDRHAEAVAAFLAESGRKGRVDIIGFHGQTVLHDPGRGLTIQIGDGQALADRTRIPVVWDMRAADVAAGGQGAPLVPVFHRALVARSGLAGPVVVANIGGVSNVTFVGGDGTLLAFDAGPGNALIDDWMLARTGEPVDRDGRVAAGGTPHEELVRLFLTDPFFALAPPKSLDRAHFDLAALGDLETADGAATLAHVTAAALAAATIHLPEPPRAWIVCGGGRRNPYLMRALGERLACPVSPAEAIGFDGDAVEAQAFGFLAVRAARGEPITFPQTTGVPRPMPGGVRSDPRPA